MAGLELCGQSQQCAAITGLQKGLNTQIRFVAYLGTGRSSHCECKQLGLVLVTVQLDFSKRSGVTFNRLTDTPIPAVELHSTLYFERRRVGRVARNTNEYQPFLVGAAAVVDDLSTNKGWMPVEDLLWRRSAIGCRPVVYRGFGDDANSRVIDPLPEDNFRVVEVRLDL